jgi:hypothetical protein
MISFDAAHKAVHYSPDRRFRIWIRPSFIVGAVILILIPFLLAWTQAAIFGLPYIPPVPQFDAASATGPHGFPVWIRYAHFFNFFFVMMLVRSGLSILMDHPRLYFNDHCTPDSEWIRFTPLRVPKDRVWTAKDDARYISPLFALPGLSPYGRSGALMALYRRLWIRYYGGNFCHVAVPNRAVEKNCTNILDGVNASLEHIRHLCQLSITTGAEWLLRI